MPSIARESLMHRLELSNVIPEVIEDLAQLTGERIRYEPTPSPAATDLVAPVRAGAVDLGAFLVEKPPSKQRQAALLRILNRVARDVARGVMQPSGDADNVIPGTIVRATRIMRDELDEPVSLSAVAAQVGVSRERLSRLFRSTLGVTFSDYLNQIRINRCLDALASTRKPSTEIAMSCGFQSISQFNRRFKAALGMSPRQYRDKVNGADGGESHRSHVA